MNVIEFSAFTKTSRSILPPIEATSEAVTSAIIQFPPESKNLSEVVKTMSREDKRRIAAVIEERINYRLEFGFDLEKEREARCEAWRKADATVQFWKACNDLWHATYVAQRCGVKAAEAYEKKRIDLDDPRRNAFLESFRAAVAQQLLTPATTLADVTWKRADVRRNFVNVPADQLDKSIDDDLAWLAKYPARERRKRR